MIPQSLQWRHNGWDSVSNHQPHDCLLNRLFRHRSKKTSKLRVTGLCAGNSPGTGEFSAQMASNAENVSIWWLHHGGVMFLCLKVIAVCLTTLSYNLKQYCIIVNRTLRKYPNWLLIQTMEIHTKGKRSVMRPWIMLILFRHKYHKCCIFENIYIKCNTVMV